MLNPPTRDLVRTLLIHGPLPTCLLEHSHAFTKHGLDLRTRASLFSFQEEIETILFIWELRLCPEKYMSEALCLNWDNRPDKMGSEHLKYQEDLCQISKMGREGIFSSPFPFCLICLLNAQVAWAWDVTHDSSSLFDLLGAWR